MKKIDLNIGNVVGTFKPEFIAKLTDISVGIQDIDVSNVDAPSDIQEKRQELLDFRKELKKVDKFINQEIVILTGKQIEAKRIQSMLQTDISIFDFVGNKDEAEIKKLESK